MTPLENFERMMRHDSPRWMPLTVPMTPPMLRELQRRTGHDSSDEAFDVDFADVWANLPHDAAAWQQAYRDLGVDVPATASIGLYGITHDHPPKQTLGAADHLRRKLYTLSTVQRVEQLEELPWPAIEVDKLSPEVEQRIAEGRRRGRVTVAWQPCSVFECSWYLRGMDELFTDMIEGRDVGTWLLDYFMRRSQTLCAMYARLGVDVIVLGDDVGMQHGMLMAPDFWRQHLKPRLAGIIAAIRSRQQPQRACRIYYHSDGNILPIIDDLIEIGVDILNPVQPECMSIDEVFSRYRDGLAFWGMIGTQTTMPFGTTDDVRQAVLHLADWVKRGAAVVVAPTHVLEPDVPWENVEALVQTCKAVRFDAAGAAA